MTDPDESDINVRCESYSIACELARCCRCGTATPVVALCLPAGHEVMETDDGEAGSPSPATSWAASPSSALIFYVDRLPGAVVARLQELCAGYRRISSPVTQAEYWANHCAACDALLEDHDLHCEPEGAFMQAFARSALRGPWPSFAEPLRAAAGGYSEDPRDNDALVSD